MKVLCLVVVLCAVAVPSTSAAAAAGGPQFFQTPSKNIGCAYQAAYRGQPASLRCDIATGLEPLPPKPKSCPVDWGLGYSMLKTGRAHPVCAGDTARTADAKTLSYGHTWRGGGFTCVAKKKTGLRCTNSSRHGFVLSRKHTKTF